MNMFILFNQESKYAVLPRNIPMMLKKKEEGPYWPRLLKEKQKVVQKIYLVGCNSYKD